MNVKNAFRAPPGCLVNSGIKSAAPMYRKLPAAKGSSQTTSTPPARVAQLLWHLVCRRRCPRDKPDMGVDQESRTPRPAADEVVDPIRHEVQVPQRCVSNKRPVTVMPVQVLLEDEAHEATDQRPK